MRRTLAVAAVAMLTACGSARAKGDRLVEQGQYDAAIEAYDTKARRALTSEEQSLIRDGRRDAYRAKLREAIDTLRASPTKPADKRKRVAELYTLALSEADSPELGEELEQTSVDVSREELNGIRSMIDAGKVGEGLSAILTLSGEILASEVANREVLQLRNHAADWLRKKAQSEPSGAVRTLLETWASNLAYSAWPASAQAYFMPALNLSGTTELCGRAVPIESVAFGIPVHLQVECNSGVNVEQDSETYTYAALEEYVESRTVCRNVQVGYGTKSVQYTRKVYDGVYSDVWETGVKTVRGEPRYERVCEEDQFIAQREVTREATRVFDVRKFWVGISGSVTLDLPHGPVTKTLKTNQLAETRAIPDEADASHSSFALSEEEALVAFSDDLPELYRRVFLGLVRESFAENASRAVAIARRQGDPASLRDAAARAVLYGGPISPELADLGFPTGGASQWFATNDAEFLVVDQVTFQREVGYASDRFDIGASFMEWDFRLRHSQLHELSNQSDRSSAMFEFAQSFSPLAQWALRDAFSPMGVVFHDDFGYRIALGRRISEAYEYPSIVNSLDQREERGGAQAAGAHAQLLVGYRTRPIGLLVGVRGRADTQRVGDAANGSAGIPLAARLELRPHPRHPIVLEAWGFSPVADRKAIGANLSIAVGDIVNIAFDADVQHGATRIRGVRSGDIVDLGRRPSYNFGLSLQLAGMFGD